MKPMTKSHLTLACLIVIAVVMHAPVLELQYWDAVTFAICLVTALALGLRWATHTALLTCLWPDKREPK